MGVNPMKKVFIRRRLLQKGGLFVAAGIFSSVYVMKYAINIYLYTISHKKTPIRQNQYGMDPRSHIKPV